MARPRVAGLRRERSPRESCASASGHGNRYTRCVTFEDRVAAGRCGHCARPRKLDQFGTCRDCHGRRASETIVLTRDEREYLNRMLEKESWW